MSSQPGPDGQLTASLVTLMGVELANMNEAEVVDHVVSSAVRGQGGWMVNPNVDVLRQIVADREVHQLVDRASLVVADGMPLLWASRLRRTPLKARVPVSEAILALCQAAAACHLGVYLLGGATSTAERAAQVLSALYPGLHVNWACPSFGFEQNHQRMAELRSSLAEAGPGIIFCAFGFPKQERLMDRLSQDFPAMWFIGSGGTFSMVAGDQPKAPAWMRKSGLEWLHRLRLEPRRLFERYVVHDLPFALRLLTSSLLAGLSRDRSLRSKRAQKASHDQA